MFRKLKDRVKVDITDRAYYTQFLQMLISMFDYENLPIRKEEIETYLLDKMEELDEEQQEIFSSMYSYL